MTTIKLRRGTAAEWTTADPVLAEGEPGFETDTGKQKIGNGTTAWNDLPYLTGGGAASAAAVSFDPTGMGNTDATDVQGAISDLDTVLTDVDATKADLVGGVVPTGQLPALAITDTFPVASQADMLALTAQRGDVAVRTDLGKSFILSADDPTVLANWVELSAAGKVTSVNGQQGVVVLAATDVGADASGAAATVQAASLQKTANLSDLANAATSRTNLGLGDAATHPASDFLTPTQANGTYVAGAVAAGLDYTGATDESAALEALLNDSDGPVVLLPGTLVATNLVVPAGKKLLALASLGAFTNPAYTYTTRLLQKPGSSSPLLALEPGSEVEGLVIDGNGNAGAVLVDVDQGFEARLRRVRLVNNATTGLLFNNANNIHFEDVLVDSCGSTTAASVQIRSYSTGLVTNGLNMAGLTVENPAGVAVDIAAGSSTVDGNDDYAEFVRIFGLHAESAVAYPLVSVGNIRSVTLIAPQLVGGPSIPVIVYNQQVASKGGLTVLGGSIVGNATNPANLIHLQAGDGFALLGTYLENCTGGALLIDSTFGADVTLQPSNMVNVASPFTDNRASGQIAQAAAADTAWRAMTLAGAWVAANPAGYAPPGYRKGSDGVVNLRGIVGSGAGQITTLPAGYRPQYKEQFVIFGSGGALATVEIGSNGAVIQATGPAPLDLSSIHYYADA